MLRRGFTLIEMLIIAPIVILSIGAFIAMIVNMTGEVLSSRGSNALTYDIQDALNRIEQDVKLSTNFLAENTIAFSGSNPQGAGDHGSTTNFANVAANSTVLILGAIVTNGNPLVAGTGNIYLKDAPNACSSFAQYSRNTPLVMNIVYFIDDRGDSDPTNDTLWRRTIMPTNYTDTANLCGGTPWQQPSCKPGYSSSFCKTNDVKLVEGVTMTDFVVQYFDTASSTVANVVASNPASSTSQRQTALDSAQTLGVSITANKKIAGRDIARTATLRATRLDANATAIADIVAQSVVGSSPSVSSRVVDGSDVVFEWDQMVGATSYSIDYRINGGSWTVGSSSLSNSQRNYKVTAAYNGATVEARVRATDSESQLSNYGNNTVSIPIWAPMQLTNGWRTYGAPYETPGYSITSSGMVIFKGLMAGGTVGASTPFSTLPTKYRPGSGNIMFSNASNQAVGRLDVRSTGEVVQNVGSNGWVSLDGISYLAGSSGFTNVSTFANGWSNYTPVGGAGWPDAAYKVDASGRVYLRGLLRGGTTTSGTNMFTLGASFLPPANQYLHLHQYVSGAISHIGVNSNSTGIEVKGGGNTYHSIQAVYFPAARASGATCTTQWCTLTLASSWVHYASPYATPQYTKASDGIVHLKGLIKNGSTAADAAITANLPAAYCPKNRLLFTVLAVNVWGRVDMVPQAGGACRLQVSSVNSTWTALDSIRYYADAV